MFLPLFARTNRRQELTETSREGCIVAIDAPTLVPNETGRRPAEAECQRLFGRYQAGPHPANRSRYKGDIRGEIIARELTLTTAISTTQPLRMLSSAESWKYSPTPRT